MTTVYRFFGVLVTGFSLVACSDVSDACYRNQAHPICQHVSHMTDTCCVYGVSLPVVPINGPFPTLVRNAAVGFGVIVQFDVPAGSPPFPTDHITVNVVGQGLMHYVGYNKCVVQPGLPGSPTRYAVFLCPLRAGSCNVEVELSFSDGTSKKVPYAFSIS